ATMLRNPCRASSRSRCPIAGSLATGSAGFGTAFVHGASRVPFPAAMQKTDATRRTYRTRTPCSDQMAVVRWLSDDVGRNFVAQVLPTDATYEEYQCGSCIRSTCAKNPMFLPNTITC